MREPRFYYVYILANASELFYVGVTNSLFRRVDQHRAGSADAFTARYRITRLLYCERYLWIDRAIAREKQLKGWRKEKKRSLIAKANPQMHDMHDYGVLVFGDAYVAKVPRNHLKMTFDAGRQRSFDSSRRTRLAQDDTPTVGHFVQSDAKSAGTTASYP